MKECTDRVEKPLRLFYRFVVFNLEHITYCCFILIIYQDY